MRQIDKQAIFVISVFFFMCLVGATLATLVAASWAPIFTFLTASVIAAGIIAGIHGVFVLAEKLFPDD